MKKKIYSNKNENTDPELDPEREARLERMRLYAERTRKKFEANLKLIDDYFKDK